MNELRFVAACLEGEGTCFPSPENDEKSAAEERKNAQKDFRKLLNTLPKEAAMEMENSAYRVVSTWCSESFERGFAAGMRLAAQALVRE